MYKLDRYLLAAVVAAMVASSTWAQNPRRGANAMTPLMLLNQESVKKELKLTDDQLQKLKAAVSKQMSARQGMREMEAEERDKRIDELNKDADKAVADLLKPDQANRLKQIALQRGGPQVFATPEVVKDLKITNEQQSQMKEILDVATTQRRALSQPGGDRQKAMEKIAVIDKDANEKLMKLLTAEQKTKWGELTGAPFTGEIKFGGRAAPTG